MKIEIGTEAAFNQAFQVRLATFLKQYRKGHGGAAYLARTCFLSRATIGRYRDGTSTPTYGRAMTILLAIANYGD